MRDINSFSLMLQMSKITIILCDIFCLKCICLRYLFGYRSSGYYLLLNWLGVLNLSKYFAITSEQCVSKLCALGCEFTGKSNSGSDDWKRFVWLELGDLYVKNTIFVVSCCSIGKGYLFEVARCIDCQNVNYNCAAGRRSRLFSFQVQETRTET